MRALTPCWLACGLAVAGPALAQSAVAPVPLAIQVVQPAPGSPLVAGSKALLVWEPKGAAGLPPGDEWEAFVSLDGGRSYPVRITPHLDRGIRQATWTIPEVPSRDMRILFRFGDERQETALEIPTSYSIVGASLAASSFQRVHYRGESARPGELGVAVWEDGSRTGGRQRRVVSLAASLHRGFDSEHREGNPKSHRAQRQRRFHSLALRARLRPANSLQAASSRSGTAVSVDVDRLLQTSRRNE